MNFVEISLMSVEKEIFSQKQWNPAFKLEIKNKHTPCLPLNKCALGVQCVTFDEMRFYHSEMLKQWQDDEKITFFSKIF